MWAQVEALWEPVPGRDKDYIRSPKANGYQSLHTVVTAEDGVPMEVQVQCTLCSCVGHVPRPFHGRTHRDMKGGEH